MADESNTRSEGGTAGAPREAPASAAKAIDIERLADKVYRLVIEDARLAQERGALVGRREDW